MALSERELLAEAQAGDLEAFAETTVAGSEDVFATADACALLIERLRRLPAE